jgi:hypothetical protein
MYLSDGILIELPSRNPMMGPLEYYKLVLKLSRWISAVGQKLYQLTASNLLISTLINLYDWLNPLAGAAPLNNHTGHFLKDRLHPLHLILQHHTANSLTAAAQCFF